MQQNDKLVVELNRFIAQLKSLSDDADLSVIEDLMATQKQLVANVDMHDQQRLAEIRIKFIEMQDEYHAMMSRHKLSSEQIKAALVNIKSINKYYE